MKTKTFLFLSLFCFPLSFLFGQNTDVRKYWIFFKDKGYGITENISLSKHSNMLNAAKSELSEKALKRRAKVLSADKIIDYTDIPVNSAYVENLKNQGFEIDNILKWFNAVTVYCSESDIEKISNLDFIKAIKPVATYKFKSNLIDVEIPKINKVSSTLVNHKLGYGNSSYQNEMINVPILHDLGINGSGVLVGMLDTGFRWKLANSLKTRKVLKEYDFVFKDSVTANESKDRSDQDSHGTLTFSTLGGFSNDTLIGPAYNASFILAKTEDVRSETKIEEDNWAKAIEWMEGLGVDVTSTSLGYNEIDNSADNYTYKDMDGKTAIITQAAELAVSKGITCVNAAGNEGSDTWKYIIVPADGKDVITVGALNSDGSKASFSSIGPTYDGRTKPDVSALGVGVYGAVAGTTNLYNPASGTSLSCPLVGGVAALMLSARPDLTPAQVMTALRNTASKALKPDNSIGWGTVNAFNAVTYYGLVFGNEPIITVDKNNLIVSTYIASQYTIDKGSVKIYYSINDQESLIAASMSSDSLINTTNTGKYTVTIPGAGLKKIKFYFSATDTKGERKHPYDASASLFAYQTNSFSIIKTGEKPQSFSLYQNYPNPFNPATNIKLSLKEDIAFKLVIYNNIGQIVNELFDGYKAAGNYSFIWDGLNSEGKPAPTGIYFYRIISDKFNQSKSMILMR
jgi:serine protease AprX